LNGFGRASVRGGDLRRCCVHKVYSRSQQQPIYVPNVGVLCYDSRPLRSLFRRARCYSLFQRQFLKRLLCLPRIPLTPSPRLLGICDKPAFIRLPTGADGRHRGGSERSLTDGQTVVEIVCNVRARRYRASFRIPPSPFGRIQLPSEYRS
jgi:hypothetical protein